MAPRVLLLLLLAPLASAQPGVGFEAPASDDVWVRFSLTENLLTKAETEAAVVEYEAGTHRLPALFVHNDLDAPIRNVTLVIIPRNVTLDYQLSQTHASNEPGKYYARWPAIQPGTGAFVVLDLWIAEDARGPFTLQALVLFEDADGNPRHSVTNLHGSIRGETSLHVVPTVGVASFLVAASAAFVLFSSRKGGP